MITLRLDKNGGINKGDIKAFEHDNLSEVYIIQLYKNGAIYDLTNKSIELTMVERKRKIGDMVTLPIYNATEGKIKLEVVSDITKQDGIYDFKLTVKDTTGLIETFPNFQVEIKNDITDSITGEIIQDPNFTILTDGLKALADYNIYKTNALKVPEIEQDIVEINEQLDTIVQYNLKDFGAVFDGVTDDTYAWEKLRDSLSDKGGVLILPIGKTILKKHIIFEKPLVVKGSFAPLLDYENGSVINMQEEGEITFRGISSSAHNINITGSIGNTGNGINFECGKPSGSNILVTEQGGNGLVIGSEEIKINVNSFNFNNIRSRSNKLNGIVVTSSETDPTKFDANAGIMINVDSCGNGESGYLFKNCANNTFININAEVSNKKGITFENAMGNTVIQPYLEGSLEYEISFDESSYQNTISKLRADMDTLTNIIDNGVENTIVGIERSKARFPFINGIYGIKKAIISSPNIGGYFSFTQLGTRDLRIAYEGYDAVVNVDARGVTQPTTYKFDKIKIGNDIVSMTNVLYGIAIINFDNCVGNYVSAKNMIVQGAKVGDFVQISTDKVHENIIFSAMVTSENIVSVRVANISSSQVNLGDITCKVMITRME